MNERGLAIVFFTLVLIAALIDLFVEKPEPHAVNKAEAAPAPLVAFPPIQGTHRMLVMRTIDGDTVVLAYLVGPEPLRVAGVNCPELNEEDGQKAKAMTEKLLPELSIVTVDLRGRDKYGRLLGDIEVGRGRWLSNALLDAKLAKPYDGR